MRKHGKTKALAEEAFHRTETVTEQSWVDFRKTGLLLFINQILHVFGWAIVFKMEDEKVLAVYPARVKFRGFEADSVTESYKKITKYLLHNISSLQQDVEGD